MEQLTINQRRVLNLLRVRGRISTQEVATLLKSSRQYAHVLLRNLTQLQKLVRIGTTIHTIYVDPTYLKQHPELLPTTIRKRFKNKNLEEHLIDEEISEKFPPLSDLKENVASIFTYAFSEMLNNAIEHSKSETIDVEVSMKGKRLIFNVIDRGIGVFRNVMVKKNLRTQEDAARELLKGKITTQPKAHSGQGIFFTSKSADLFILESGGIKLVIDSVRNDVHITRAPSGRKGTAVRFLISTDSKRHLSHVFEKYETEGDNFKDFNKTEVKVALYSKGVLVSRSQARKILSHLDQFEAVVLDYENIPIIGQAFADEIYRVFKLKHPKTLIYSMNTTAGVQHMINRALPPLPTL